MTEETDTVRGTPGAGRPTPVLEGAEQRRLLERLAQTGAPRHIFYAAGPGDVQATYRHWRAGEDDPSGPAIAYSQQIFELAAALKAKLTVVVRQPVDPALSGDRVRFIHLPRRTGRGIAYHWGDFQDARALVRLALGSGADTFLMQPSGANLWPLVRLAGGGRRLIFSLHNMILSSPEAMTLTERLSMQASARAFAKADGIVCVSQRLAEQVADLVPIDAGRILVQVPQYGEIWRRMTPLPPEDGSLRVLYAGRMIREKGIFDLLEAFDRIAPKHPEARLEFIGDGGALSALRDAAAGVARVEVAGHMNGPDLQRRIRQAALVVCPTSAHFPEGLAKPPIEAALAGVPSVITTTAPVSDFLDDGCVSVPPDDVDALSEALDGLLRDDARRRALGAAARERAGAVLDRSLSLGARVLEVIARAPGT